MDTEGMGSITIGSTNKLHAILRADTIAALEKCFTQAFVENRPVLFGFYYPNSSKTITTIITPASHIIFKYKTEDLTRGGIHSQLEKLITELEENSRIILAVPGDD